MLIRTLKLTWLPLVLGATCVTACGGANIGDGSANGEAATSDSEALTSAASIPHDLIPTGGKVLPRSADQLAAGSASLAGLTYPSTLVGTNGKVTVYYATSLGAQGQAQGQQFLNRAMEAYNDMQNIFGITGGAVTVVISPRSGLNDGSGGAVHGGCDFSSAGGTLYLDATFANTTVDPLSFLIGLYTAELSESFMGAQNKGWICNYSNGEGLSRYLAEYEMAPNLLPSGFITGPSWAATGKPDWISQNKASDTDYPSTGASIVYINSMLSQGYSISQIARTAGSTLAANYKALTGSTANAYSTLVASLSGIAVSSDNPWGITARAGGKRIKGDFNGDGIEDVLIENSSGTYEYLGHTGYGFTQGWSRTDLVLNATDYIPGDFNGDGLTDIIIVNRSGSYEYLGARGGGFTDGGWSRTDLTLGKVSYIPGDFSGDGKTDLLIVTAGGTYEYLGLAGGGFSTNAWVRTDLTLGTVGYVPGDFNGDGKADMIIETAGGSYEYLGAYGGGFTDSGWARGDLALGTVSYFPGDFNGDGKMDLIIVNSSGSYEYTGLAGGGFYGNAWVRTDLVRGLVSYKPGDFNGDGKADLMIVTAGGSYEYTGLAAGGFTPTSWSRADLVSSNVDYVPADLNGDGISDILILTPGGTFEYTGVSGWGFTATPWARTDLAIHTVSYF